MTFLVSACDTDGMNSGCAGSRSLRRGVNSGTSGSMTAVCLEGTDLAASFTEFSFGTTSGGQVVGVLVGGGVLEVAEGRLLLAEDG